MIRVPDWETRLAQHLDQARDRPFVWGQHDCVLFAVRWLELATGTGYLGDLPGRYHDRDGALRQLWQRCGTVDLVAVVTSHLGPPLVCPALARRGDLLGHDGGLGCALGVHAGGWGAFAGPDRLAAVPLSDIKLAWSV